MSKRLGKMTIKAKLLLLAPFCLVIFATVQNVVARFTFIGDYDRTNFAASNGYYVEPQNNLPQDATPNRQTYIVSGDLNSDGSTIAGDEFGLRKFTASGAVDTSFGGGRSYVRTIWNSTKFDSNRSQSLGGRQNRFRQHLHVRTTDSSSNCQSLN